jgi:hypothetical protein
MSRSFAGSRGSIMSCRTGLCAHYHYLRGIVNPDPLTGAGWPRRYHHPSHHQPTAGPESEGKDGKRVPSFIRLVFAVNLLVERG